MSLDREVGGLPDLLPLVAEDLRVVEHVAEARLRARCAACDGHPAIGIAIGTLEDSGQEIGSALLDPGRGILSLANAILAAVGKVISTNDLTTR